MGLAASAKTQKLALIQSWLTINIKINMPKKIISVKPSIFGLNQAGCVKKTYPYKQFKLILNYLQKSIIPINKMKIILNRAEMMTKEI